MTKKKLQYFGGNYDSFVQTKAEMDENQQKRYKKEQDEIAHMKVRVVCPCMPYLYLISIVYYYCVYSTILLLCI